jgi:hypothetical protein
MLDTQIHASNNSISTGTTPESDGKGPKRGRLRQRSKNRRQQLPAAVRVLGGVAEIDVPLAGEPSCG